MHSLFGSIEYRCSWCGERKDAEDNPWALVRGSKVCPDCFYERKVRGEPAGEIDENGDLREDHL